MHETGICKLQILYEIAITPFNYNFYLTCSCQMKWKIFIYFSQLQRWKNKVTYIMLYISLLSIITMTPTSWKADSTIDENINHKSFLLRIVTIHNCNYDYMKFRLYDTLWLISNLCKQNIQGHYAMESWIYCYNLILKLDTQCDTYTWYGRCGVNQT